jgi:hypothetical protein
LFFRLPLRAQTTIGEVEGTFPLPANFMNYVGRTIEVCGLISKTSTVADTVDDIQIWWDAEGSNVTAGTPVQISSIKLTSTGTAAFTTHFCQQLTTTVAAATATGGTITAWTGMANQSRRLLQERFLWRLRLTGGCGRLAESGSAGSPVSVELVHTTGTDGAGSTLLGATVRIVN